MRRARLAQLIEHRSRGAVVLVSAPAGFGKSTAVVDWSLTSGRSATVSWVSLDSHDNNPSRFWGHVLAALHELDESVGHESAEWLSETVDGDALLFVSTFLNELMDVGSDRWLVLDDVHLIENGALLQQLDYVIHHLPSNLHLIMTSRIDPGLELHRLRANAELADVRADELMMMTGDEIGTFVTARCGQLDDETIRDLESRTDGWPVAVQLTTVRLAQSEDPARYLADSMDDARPVVDYMVAEILDNLPATLRTFVLEISVLHGFSEEISDNLLDTNDSRRLIRQVLDRGLFVNEAVGEERWYRFHHLFADILRSELRYRDHARWIELNRRTAALLAGRGELDQAMDHARLGEDWDFVIGHATEAFQQFANRGHMYRFRDWLAPVPDDEVDRDVTTTTLVGLAHLFSHDFDEAERHFEKAVSTDEVDNEALPSLSARAFLALVAGNRNDAALWQHRARVALEAVPKDGTHNTQMAESLAAAQLAAANYYRGDLDGALSVGQRLLDLTDRIDSPVPRAAAFGAVGLARAFAGQVDAAQSAVDHMSSIIDGTDMEVRINGSVRDELRGRVAFESDDLDEALSNLGRAWEARWVRPVARPGIAAMLSRTHLGWGDHGRAHDWLRRAETALADVDFHPFGQLEVFLAELALVEAGIELERSADLPARFSDVRQHLSGDPALLATVGIRRARCALDQSAMPEPIVEPFPRGPRASLQLHLLRARHQTDEFIRTQELVAALDLVQSSGLIRAVREWGQEMAGHILRLCRDHPAAASVEGLAREREDAANQLLVEPLTASEIRVLVELTSGDSYQEIAGRLFVSQNTVMSHVKAVYRKLDVHMRLAAVDRGRELGLLDPAG